MTPFFSEDIEKGEQKTINILSDRIKDWIKGQIPQKAMEEIQNLFENGVDVKKHLQSTFVLTMYLFCNTLCSKYRVRFFKYFIGQRFEL